jgi:hypothetical protein
MLQPERDDVLQEPIAVGLQEFRATLLEVGSHEKGCSRNRGQVNAGPLARHDRLMADLALSVEEPEHQLIAGKVQGRKPRISADEFGPLP